MAVNFSHELQLWPPGGQQIIVPTWITVCILFNVDKNILQFHRLYFAIDFQIVSAEILSFMLNNAMNFILYFQAWNEISFKERHVIRKIMYICAKRLREEKWERCYF